MRGDRHRTGSPLRDRIAEHVKPRSVWDFKYFRGGLFDIDFCVQYLALREAIPEDMLKLLDQLDGDAGKRK